MYSNTNAVFVYPMSGTHRTTFQSTQAPLLTSVTLYNKGYSLQHTTILLSLRTLNRHSNNYARKFTPIYTLNLSSRTIYNILKKKQEEKSYDMQNFTPNYSKYSCDVISTNFDPVKLRNGEICPEYSRKKYASRKL